MLAHKDRIQIFRSVARSSIDRIKALYTLSLRHQRGKDLRGFVRAIKYLQVRPTGLFDHIAVDILSDSVAGSDSALQGFDFRIALPHDTCACLGRLLLIEVHDRELHIVALGDRGGVQEHLIPQAVGFLLLRTSRVYISVNPIEIDGIETVVALAQGNIEAERNLAVCTDAYIYTCAVESVELCTLYGIYQCLSARNSLLAIGHLVFYGAYPTDFRFGNNGAVVQVANSKCTVACGVLLKVTDIHGIPCRHIRLYIVCSIRYSLDSLCTSRDRLYDSIIANRRCNTHLLCCASGNLHIEIVAAECAEDVAAELLAAFLPYTEGNLLCHNRCGITTRIESSLQCSGCGTEVLKAESNQFVEGNHGFLIQPIPSSGGFVLDTRVANGIVDSVQAVFTGIRVHQVHMELQSVANQHHHNTIVLSRQLLCRTALQQLI